MNRLPYFAHSLPAATALPRVLASAAGAGFRSSRHLPYNPTAVVGLGRFNSTFQHGLQPFPFGFTPVHRSSNTGTTTAAHTSQPQSPIEVAQSLAPELVDELQLASALDNAAAIAAAEAIAAASNSPMQSATTTELFDSPTAALDSAAAAAAETADPKSTAPNLSWFVDPAATDMLPLWQRNLLDSAADTAIAERTASASSAQNLDDLLLASDGKLTPTILSEFLAQHGGQDVVVLDTSVRSDVTDAMVIATSASTAHMVSLASRLHAFIKEQITLAVDSQEEREAAVAAISVEGMECDDWVLLDLGRVFVHVMTAKGRSEYDLDGLWGGKSMASKDAQEWDQGQLRSMPPGPVVFDEQPPKIQLTL